jgi:hypothetical protein
MIRFISYEAAVGSDALLGKRQPTSTEPLLPVPHRVAMFRQSAGFTNGK